MNHCVPNFEMEEDYSIPSSAGLARQNNKPEDEIMELLWQNGQVVIHSQNHQRFPRRSSPPPQSYKSHHLQPPPYQPPPPAPHPDSDSATHLFTQEDEMVSWLHYPLDYYPLDRGLYADLLYQPPPATAADAAARAVEVQATPADPPQPRPQVAEAATASRPPTLPPPPPPLPAATAAGDGVNFPHFSRMRASSFPDSRPSTGSKHDQPYHHNAARERESTVVDSSDTPMEGISKSRVSQQWTRSAMEVTDGGWSFGGRDTMSGGGGGRGGRGEGCCPSVSREGETCELMLTSSPGGSGASASATATAEMGIRLSVDDRKRKSREAAATAATADCHSEDAEIESSEAKKQSRGSTATKRSRAAVVHNLSERRRRDRINEKMRALQELIPRCSKTDKASMLDEAIDYLKSLQLQVQMMSMGCGMIPAMMFPGVQQYMPPIGMGMGMGMGLDMGMSRPMMPFPAILANPALQTLGVASPLGPRFQLPTFPMHPPVPPLDMSRIQVTGQADSAINPLCLSGQPSLPMIPNMVDPYQQYLGLHQMRVQSPQATVVHENQQFSQPSTSKPSTRSGGSAGNKNPQNG